MVVLTLNEEPNLRRYLSSVGCMDQVMLHSGSDDRIVVAAKSMSAQVVEQPWLDFSSHAYLSRS